MKRAVEASVVICTYNRATEIGLVLDDLAAQAAWISDTEPYRMMCSPIGANCAGRREVFERHGQTMGRIRGNREQHGRAGRC